MIVIYIYIYQAPQLPPYIFNIFKRSPKMHDRYKVIFYEGNNFIRTFVCTNKNMFCTLQTRLSEIQMQKNNK